MSLARGQRASCVRCGATLAKRAWWGTDAVVPLGLSALALAAPAAFMPYVTLGKFGRAQSSHVGDVAGGLWDFGLPALAGWVWFCGVLAPLALVTLLLLRAAWRPRSTEGAIGDLDRAAERVAFWAMPEVQVLGVLVSFFKLGDVVDAQIGAGFWCYAGAAACVLLAWRRHSLEPRTGAGKGGAVK